jgi:hypothetical protein
VEQITGLARFIWFLLAFPAGKERERKSGTLSPSDRITLSFLSRPSAAT